LPAHALIPINKSSAQRAVVKRSVLVCIFTCL
jgi:hypothetical protein